MKTNSFKVSLLVLIATISGVSAHAAPAPTAAAPFKLGVEQGTGKVVFNAVGRPKALKIKGTGSAPKGNLQVINGKLIGELSFDLNSLDTENKLRNTHMREKYLETDKHPIAKLTFKDVQIPASLIQGDASESVDFTGILDLHGVSKPVSGKAQVKRSGKLVEVDASFGILISDFNISEPGFAGVTMAKDVAVEVQLSAPVL